MSPAWSAAVDAMLVVPTKPPPEHGYRGGGGRFGGRWIGAYTQMVLAKAPWPFELELDRDGDRLFGRGRDATGRFQIEGSVDAAGEARMTKKYSTHQVAYFGDLDVRSLRGVWLIKGKKKAIDFGLFAIHHEDVVDREARERRLSPRRPWYTRWLIHSSVRIDSDRHHDLTAAFIVACPALEEWFA